MTHAGDAEWLLTDGRGGYGCGTAADLPMRRYHGLWVARPEGTARRRMVVAGLDERIGPSRVVGGGEEPAWAHLLHAHWRALPSPSPAQAEVSFVRRPLPTWTFDSQFGVLQRTVALRRAEGSVEPALLVRWRNRSPQPLRLLVRPLLGWCDADHLLPADESFDGTVTTSGASWGVRPSELLPTLWLTVDGVAAFTGEPSWYRGFLHAMDRDRGYDHVGDRWCPGVIELDLPPNGDAVAAFTLAEPCSAAAAAFDEAEQSAQAQWRGACTADDTTTGDATTDEASAERVAWARLALGADDFLYRPDGGRLGVLAGYPWFGEWGRDVFIALPGLTLARGRVDRCAEVLTGAVPFLRDGLLPNIYGRDVDSSHYGSCDAALWFALAVMRFADAADTNQVDDAALVRERLVPALESIAAAYEQGTDLGLAMAKDGLLRAGRPDLNATWMDAQTSTGPVTPREGLPVEIQALWYALLAFLAEQVVEPERQRWLAVRDRCGKAFVDGFWLADGNYLADRLHDGVADRSVRPNMLVAAALSRSPLSVAQRMGVVEKARATLLTPCGLRTLAPDEPAYIGRYGGGIEARDRAYHQGTVWPWPAGFYVEAALWATASKQRGSTAQALLGWLDELLVELDRAGIDHISEVFDGDAPHRPGGTFAQAWNTGELLRARALCVAAISAKRDQPARRSGK